MTTTIPPKKRRAAWKPFFRVWAPILAIMLASHIVAAVLKHAADAQVSWMWFYFPACLAWLAADYVRESKADKR